MNFSGGKLRCVKGIPMDSVHPEPLSELGFPVDAPLQPCLLYDPIWESCCAKLAETPYDVVGAVEKEYVRAILALQDRAAAFEKTLSVLYPYGVTEDELAAELRSGCVYDLSVRDVQLLYDEFRYILETLLPRQLSDIYDSFNILPNPAHAVFFDLVVEAAGIERYANPGQNQYRQLIRYPEEGICRRIRAGELFQKIYYETCATKKMILDAWRCCQRQDYADDVHTCHVRKIEYALFSLSAKYTCSMEEMPGYGQLFRVMTGEISVLTIVYLSQELIRFWGDYGKACAACEAMPEQPLILDFDEIESGVYLSSLIRASLKDRDAIASHNTRRKFFFTYERIQEDCRWNAEACRTANVCGCFSCLSVFCADEIRTWKEKDTACCPYCGESTVLADTQGYPITGEFLHDGKLYAESAGMIDEEMNV